MSPIFGLLLVLGMLILIFFGPQWGLKLTRKPKRYRRLVRQAFDSQLGRMAGRRKNNRVGTGQTSS